MDALKVKVRELMKNQDQMLNALKYLKEKLEDVTNKVNREDNDVRDILESREMVDAIVVKNSDDIASMKKMKDENNTAIKILDLKINKMNKEIEIKCNE